MNRDTGSPDTSELSKLHVEILTRYAMGDSSRQVARAVGASEATMRRGLREARDLLGAVNTMNAVYLAAKAALI